MTGQDRHILAALGECRDVDADHVQSMEQIFAKAAGADQGLQILVRRSDHSYVRFHWLVPADPIELTVGQDA